jgi:glycosyltransferase involved in cell wall biosynthesis
VIACISENIQKEVESLGAQNCRIVYLGIDTQLYKPDTSKSKNIVFTVSHFTDNHIQRKRLFEIIDAAKIVLNEFPDIQFVIAGAKTSAKDKIIKRIEQAGLSSSFQLQEGISEKEKIAYMQESLVYLQPTLHEAFGVANAEAMSCGTPVVTSQVGAVPEVVGDCGLYANPNDVREIADKVLYLLKNDKLRNDLGLRARERIKQHLSYDRRKKEIKEMINTLET